MNLIKYTKAKFERNKLLIDESISLDEWKELGSALKQIEGSVQFWIGDWARFGDKMGFTGKYTNPKVYDELEEITGLDRKTLQNYKSIAENVESSRRREDLAFSHHAEVAKLPAEEQGEVLQKASEDKLSVRQLRKELRDYKDKKGLTFLKKSSGKKEINHECIDCNDIDFTDLNCYSVGKDCYLIGKGELREVYAYLLSNLKFFEK